MSEDLKQKHKSTELHKLISLCLCVYFSLVIPFSKPYKLLPTSYSNPPEDELWR